MPTKTQTRFPHLCRLTRLPTQDLERIGAYPDKGSIHTDEPVGSRFESGPGPHHGPGSSTVEQSAAWASRTCTASNRSRGVMKTRLPSIGICRRQALWGRLPPGPPRGACPNNQSIHTSSFGRATGSGPVGSRFDPGVYSHGFGDLHAPQKTHRLSLALRLGPWRVSSLRVSSARAVIASQSMTWPPLSVA